MGNLIKFEPSLLLVIKIAVIILLLFYSVFAGVLIKQVNVMTETLQVGFEKPIKLIAFIHFIFTIIVLFISIFVL